ncbi:amino acid ABC transporter substrate-binding protein [Chitinimonas arctica]|uniref:Amino acid ABC transporter substrate-binding protein n=1 Tax=Chitinimonas arctica TaxID=2594795 RepID=A0A516SD14_9NEIS|nr:transporter substrate-binding domain-containing protein [Chitinimonas arctica]QDQ26045.1 amino acid ABC transporter substrate-binding protein [Chitinimonas arctica]
MFRLIPLIWLLLAATVSAAPFRVVLAEYAPYSWMGEQGPKGLEVEILQEVIARRMQVPLSIEILPWARAQLYVEQGVADAFVAYPSERRRQYTVISEQPMADWSVVLYTASNHPRLPDLARVDKPSQLQPFRIGSLNGNNWVDEHLAGMEIDRNPTVEPLLRMLVAGRIDVLPDSPTVVNYYLRVLKLNGQVKALNRVAERSLHLCIGRKSRYLDIMARFDATMRQLRRDGTLARILSRYQ